MARVTKVEKFDDQDWKDGEGVPTPAEREVVFGLNGRHFRTDLTEAHAKELEDFLADFVEYAEEIKFDGTAKRRTSTGAIKRVPRDLAPKIREWGEKQGFKVSDRGRIPGDVLKAYGDAYPEDAHRLR